MAEALPDVKHTLEIFKTMLSPEVKDDLLVWVNYAFRWGAANTELERHKGPRAWQRDELNRISEHIYHRTKNWFEKGMTPKFIIPPPPPAAVSASLPWFHGSTFGF